MTRVLVPNSTQVPDVILDFWLAELSGAELKVVLYVARRTFGFGKTSDRISLSQLSGGIKRRDGTVLDLGTGMSRSTVKTACSGLVRRGLLVKETNTVERTGEFCESTYRLNLNWTGDRVKKLGLGQVGRRAAHPGRNHAVTVGRESAKVGQKRLQDLGRKSTPQETEHIQETAAGVETADGMLLLIDRLVEAGLNLADAQRLARAVPEECERQLAHLQHLVLANFRFTRGRGAFLRRAIEGGFAPPDGFKKAEVTRQRAQSQAEKVKQSRNTESARISERKQRLQSMRIEEPDRYKAFIAFLESRKRQILEKPIISGAPAVRQRLIEAYDKEEVKLEVFEEFLAAHPA